VLRICDRDDLEASEEQAQEADINYPEQNESDVNGLSVTVNRIDAGEEEKVCGCDRDEKACYGEISEILAIFNGTGWDQRDVSMVMESQQH